MGAETETSTEETKTSTTTAETGKSTTDTGKAGGKEEGGSTGSEADKASDKAGDDKALKKALDATRKERDTLAKQIRDGELAKLPELERYKSLSEELTKENAELKIDNQRRQVAMEMNLPWSLGKRLTGDTLEEMREDASDLAKNYKVDSKTTVPKDPKNEVKTTNDQKSAKGGAGKPGMNEALRALAGRSLS